MKEILLKTATTIEGVITIPRLTFQSPSHPAHCTGITEQPTLHTKAL